LDAVGIWYSTGLRVEFGGVVALIVPVVVILLFRTVTAGWGGMPARSVHGLIHSGPKDLNLRTKPRLLTKPYLSVTVPNNAVSVR
jgi:hypothetical protein